MRILISDNTEDKLKDAFRKLQDYIYFENTDLHIREQLSSSDITVSIKRIGKWKLQDLDHNHQAKVLTIGLQDQYA